MRGDNEGEEDGMEDRGRKKWQKEKNGSLWISGLIGSLLLLSEREATHSTASHQITKHNIQLTPSLPLSLPLSPLLHHPIVSGFICFSLSLQLLLSKLIRTSELRSQRGDRHPELLPSLSPSPHPFSSLPFFSCLL